MTGVRPRAFNPRRMGGQGIGGRRTVAAAVVHEDDGAGPRMVEDAAREALRRRGVVVLAVDAAVADRVRRPRCRAMVTILRLVAPYGGRNRWGRTPVIATSASMGSSSCSRRCCSERSSRSACPQVWSPRSSPAARVGRSSAFVVGGAGARSRRRCRGRRPPAARRGCAPSAGRGRRRRSGRPPRGASGARDGGVVRHGAQDAARHRRRHSAPPWSSSTAAAPRPSAAAGVEPLPRRGRAARESTPSSDGRARTRRRPTARR